MKKLPILSFLLFIAVVLIVWWLLASKSRAPEVPFAKVMRETLTSRLETNGKVEPLEWVDVHAERAGAVQKMLAQMGQTVAAGAPLLQLDSSVERAALAEAEARVTEAKAQCKVLVGGGRAAEIADIDASLNRARFDIQGAEKDYAALQRLQAQQAATAQEVAEARNRMERARLQIDSLQQKRASLVTPSDRAVAEARLKDAEAAGQLARQRLEMTILRAPIGGTVYNLPARVGTYLNAGDLVASIGELGRVRVVVYVDEPELGRVAAGMPVTITWDALPKKEWNGTVDRTPTQVIALGTRQVGEVVCVIENPGRELLPGTNINAWIRSKVVPNALTIPKECLRRQGSDTGVFVLEGESLAWRVVQTGTSSITRVQATSGLAEGDAVALATELTLKSGMKVRAIYP